MHAPIAITYLGSGICSYSLNKAGAILCVIVPAQINKSACLGEPLKTTEPNLAISLFDATVCIISIPQQEVAKAEVQPSHQKPVKKQRKVVVTLVELIPDSETEPTNLKALPSSVIDKVKAYDQQSDLSRTTGIDDTDPFVAMAAQVEDIRTRGKRLEEEITAFMNN